VNQIVPKTLLSIIGSFWTRMFRSAALLKELFRGVLSSHLQSETAANELVVSVSAKEVPAGRTTSWEKFVFGDGDRSRFEHGDLDSKYGTSYLYGEPSSNRGEYSCDPTILSVPFLYDDPVNPTKILCRGIDYALLPGKIVFKTPLSYTSGETVTFYARNVRREEGFVTSRLGYVLNVQLADKVYLSVPFDSIWRMYSYGATWLDVMKLLGAASSTQVTLQDETVELVQVDRDVTLVYTDKAAYAGPTLKSRAFGINQMLPQGEPVFSGLEILHDKDQYLPESIPYIFREGNLLKFGSELAQGNSLIIVKADILGDASAALKILPNVVPADIRLLVLTNVDAEPIQLPASAFAGSTSQGQSELSTLALTDTGVLVNSWIQLSAKAVKKYKYSGF